ncbi:hypothetical protein [Synechococcus sp. CS-1332]|uniref:hypothetical protein n=1 Tax=Synechococcus sp. CS-1332 TaxID=2847972 RepID=UPI00223BF7C8|nr:hypothetical protein [Synechococcus sp. CS-1332]MCT0208866.1 hypothetical protein [Synechococcus sp. CS-1332]
MASQLAVITVFILFSFGLLAATRLKTGARGSTNSQSRKVPEERNDGLDLLAGLIAFGVVCNILLILPGLIERLTGSGEQPILMLHRFCSGLSTAAVLVVALLGFLALMQSNHWPVPKPLRSITSPLASRFGTDAINPINDASLRVLFFVPAVYLLSVPYLGLQYDTGLYHLPSVLHFQAFGPELGLANFHFSFGFFNLQQFAQVSLQNLSPSRFILSPSLNLIFLEAFILTVVSSLASIQKPEKPNGSRQTTTRALLYLATGLLFGIQSLNSLVSFDADFAVSMTTLMLVYIVYFCGPGLRRDQALALSLFLPLLKLSGALGLALILLLELLHQRPAIKNYRLRGAFRVVGLALRTLKMKSTLAGATLLAYAGMLATNLITSGYLLFPLPMTGPWGEQAVPLASTKFIRSALVTNYARFDDNISLSASVYPKHLTLSDWLPRFLSTSRGQLMTFWIVSALVLFLVLAAMTIASRRKIREQKLMHLSACLLPVTVLALLALPPNPRFFPWIGSLIGFEFTELVIFYPLISLLTSTLLMSLLSVRLQRSLLKATGPEQYSIRSLSKNQLYGWHSRHESAADSKGIQVRSPKKDKCWSIQPPCTPYLPSAEGKSKKTTMN